MTSMLIDGGCSIVVSRPRLAIEGLKGELEKSLGAASFWLVSIDGGNDSPARLALQAAGESDALSREVGPQTVAELPALAGRVFWYEPLDAADMNRWMGFIDSFVVVCRARPETDWPRFVIALGPDIEPPQRKTGLETFDLGTAVSTTDLLLLAHYHVGTALGDSVKAQVIAQTAVSLAQWDMVLLAVLLDETPERIMDPLPILQDYAAQLGWSAADQPTWAAGSLRRHRSKEIVHSAFLALDDHKSQVSVRVWAGQASVLLPIIERKRIELIDQNISILQRALPIQAREGSISEPYDLEIGFVWFLLKNGNASSNNQSRALRLKMARNSLAHMTPLTSADAFSPDLSDN